MDHTGINRKDLDQRYEQCIRAAEGTMGRQAAASVCAQAVYASRGFIVRAKSNSGRSKSRRRSSQKSRRRRMTQRS